MGSYEALGDDGSELPAWECSAHALHMLTGGLAFELSLHSPATFHAAMDGSLWEVLTLTLVLTLPLTLTLVLWWVIAPPLPLTL